MCQMLGCGIQNCQSTDIFAPNDAFGDLRKYKKQLKQIPFTTVHLHTHNNRLYAKNYTQNLFIIYLFTQWGNPGIPLLECLPMALPIDHPLKMNKSTVKFHLIVSETGVWPHLVDMRPSSGRSLRPFCNDVAWLIKIIIRCLNFDESHSRYVTCPVVIYQRSADVFVVHTKWFIRRTPTWLIITVGLALQEYLDIESSPWCMCEKGVLTSEVNLAIFT